MIQDSKAPIATATIAHDKRKNRLNTEGKYPIALRVVSNREKRDFSTGVFLSEEEFELYQANSNKKEIKAFKKFVTSELKKANDIINTLGDNFTFARFKELLKGGVVKAKSTKLYDYFESVIEEKKADQTKTTYKVYENTLSSLKAYKKHNPDFKEIDINYLKGYKKWFLNGARGETSLSIYLRTLRAVLNMAIDEGIMKQEHYPFGKGKSGFKIPNPRNIKKALTIADIKKIATYEPINEAEAYNRDLWLFSYLCNGMNFKDIALLRFKNIGKNGIVVNRSKTKESSKKQIFVPLLPLSRAIIERWSNKDKKPDNLVFDLVPDNTPSERFVPTKNQRIKLLNKYIKDIFAKLELGEYSGLMAARHSFATVMKRSGASTESISEALGHSNLKTTMNYLDSLEHEEKMKLQQNLVNF